MRAGLIGRVREGRTAAAVIAVVAAATVGTALIFQHGLGYLPCELCLQQRLPYYAAIPLALALAVVPLQPRWRAVGLGLLGLVFLVSAGLGAYHAGVEWGLWPGPSGCGGAPPPAAEGVNDFLRQLETSRVVSCTEAAWRLFGVSMAGWNALISLGLALVAFLASQSAARDPARKSLAGAPAPQR